MDLYILSKALVLAEDWVEPPPQLANFAPGYNAYIQAESGDTNTTAIDFTPEFNTPMESTAVSSAISFNFTSSGNAPSISYSKYQTLTTTSTTRIPRASILQCDNGR